MKKIIVPIVIVAVIALFVTLVNSKQFSETNISNQTRSELVPLSEVNRESLIAIPEVSLPAPKLSLPSLSTTHANQAWETFQNYLAAANAHNLEMLRRYSHQISEVCDDPTKEQECFARMDSVATVGESFRQDNFTNVWADDKQIILSTDYLVQQDANGLPLAGISRSIIYFTIDDDGNPRILTFNDFDGAFILLEEGVDAESALASLVRDSDQDGVPDDIENCIAGELSCQKTNPNLKDSDGDGWWDSVENFFYAQ